MHRAAGTPDTIRGNGTSGLWRVPTSADIGRGGPRGSDIPCRTPCGTARICRHARGQAAHNAPSRAGLNYEASAPPGAPRAPPDQLFSALSL